MVEFRHQPLFELPHDHHATPWRALGSDGIRTVQHGSRRFVELAPRVLSRLCSEAIRDVSHLFRPGHLAQLRAILDDPEASANDRFVALELLKNANVSAGMVLPSCQDTGTAIVIGKRGDQVLVDGDDEEALARGVFDVYQTSNLRYSQMAPLTMFDERNTGTNLPAQIELYAQKGAAYEFLFITKGGGSANKSYLFQETRAVLEPQKLLAFLDAKLRSLGTAACPPYHLAIVIGGTSAESTLKTVKLASCRWLDALPTSGNELGRAFRDHALERQVLELARRSGIGAQFGGKYFCHDVRVIRLPRHGASCPIGIGVSCSADRQILGRIDEHGAFLEQLETNPARFLPEVDERRLAGEVVRIDLRQPMAKLRAELSRHPIKTRFALSGPLIVARDIAHAKLAEMLARGEGLPAYVKDHVIYYAGPAKQPAGHASGSFGPTTAGRMDSYVDAFMRAGGSYVTLAKGNRSKAVTDACKAHGGFYLGSIGGPAAILAQNCIRKVETIAFPELGMEAIWRIEVEDFPAFLVVDDKGNDFFAGL
ncbi:MAG: fumarate hydratase [Planctomycetes bacterium]|nr:fumarate hydratase [Planctomycetota bacterium]